MHCIRYINNVCVLYRLIFFEINYYIFSIYVIVLKICSKKRYQIELFFITVVLSFMNFNGSVRPALGES